MLKILIVEDEDFERKALRYLVNKYFSNSLKIIGEASNGLEAIEHVKQNRPDLILMDINMPIMDGLKASKRIKDIDKHIEILILTAYDTFTYAREALKCGVSDYLVKPFTNSDFEEAISNTIKTITDRKTIISNQLQRDEGFQAAISFIERKLITKIAHEGTKEEIEENMEILQIESNLTCCLIINNSNDIAFNEHSLKTCKDFLNNIFSQVLGTVFPDHMVLFIFDDNIKDLIVSDEMLNIMPLIIKDFKTKDKLDIKIQIGPIVNDIEKYNWSYNQARIQLNKSNIQIDGKHNKDALINITNTENIIISYIINEDEKMALKATKILTDLIISKYKHNDIKSLKNDIEISIQKLIANISDFIGNDSVISLDNSIKKNIINATNYNDLVECFNNIVKKLILNIAEYNNMSNISIVENAKEFINNNYMNDIRLEDVANHVWISSYYLSRIFKQHEGINYIQYLTKVRMEKAKELMVDNSMTIKEVAISVGYMDQNYFSRAFKKYTGSSPRCYSSCTDN